MIPPNSFALAETVETFVIPRDILATCLAVGGLGYVVKVLMETDLVVAMHDALADRPFVSRFSSPLDTPNGKP